MLDTSSYSLFAQIDICLCQINSGELHKNAKNFVH